MSTALLRAWLTIEARAGRESGASLVEYSLLVAVMALTTITAIRYLGAHQSAQFNSIAAQI